MINFIEICESTGILKVLLFIKQISNIVFTIIPIGLIILIVIDFYKNVISKNTDETKKILSKVIKRIIYCIILFLVPTIINLTIDLIETTGINIPYTSCWKNASPSNLKKLEIDQAKKFLSKAETSPNDKNLLNAQNAVSQITDDKQRKIYEKKVEEVSKKVKEQKLKEKEAKEAEKKIINGTTLVKGKTQAKDFNELGDKAYNRDQAAQREWIEKVAKIVQSAQHSKYGIKNSLIIAQIINESGWMRTPHTINQDGSTLTNTCNNILGVNYDMGKKISSQDSAWSKNPQKCANSSVTQRDSNNNTYGTIEDMRKYSSIEECIEDYANIVYLYHPECKNNNNIECYRSFINGYTPVAEGHTPVIEEYINTIKNFNLEKYDK